MNEYENERTKSNLEDTKVFILQSLATTYSDDIDFLKKVNKLTFGLSSK